MSEPRVIENLRHGARVRTSDGEDIGKLHAIIVDPRDNRVTHIAVSGGPFFPDPGFGSPTIVSVDLEDVRDAGEDHVDLRIDQAAFEDLPLYSHTHFVEIPDEERTPEDARGRPALWETGLALVASLSSLATGIAVPAEHFRKASYERHILNDAPVWRIEPNTHIGYVERVLIDEASGEIEALVVKRGVLFHEETVLPVRYVKDISDGVIRVQISDADLKYLDTFK
ncbi:MAG TPA: PRC-barrel domain-containing protein [Dehalococcoidia bacterium]|nr:PRC-barrel domain-containing protein [Dehalococcoidia bacterium]